MARAQGAQANAKEDTLFLALGGALTADLSQRLTNITASGAGAFEAPSTRSVLPTTRSVTVRWEATAAEVGVVLMICGNAAQTDIVWAIATDGTGRICGYINGSVGVVTATLPTAAKDYSIMISARPNPDTTVAGDAMISELWIYNHTDGTIDDIVQATHAISAAATGPYDLSIGGWWNGAALTSVPVNPVTVARVSATHHPYTEAQDDWVAARVAYAGLSADGPTEPAGPIPSSSGLGDEGQIAGRHPWGYAAAHAVQTRVRGWSPVVNEAYNDDADLIPAQQNNWGASAPGDQLYTIDLSWLRWEQVPEESSHLRVRVHLRSWVTSGLAVPLHVRCYVLNRTQQTAQIGAVTAPALQYTYGEADVTIDDELGDGVWLDLGPVGIHRIEDKITGWTNTCAVVLAYAVDPAGLSGNDDQLRFVLDAVHAVPAITGGPWQVVQL